MAPFKWDIRKLLILVFMAGIPLLSLNIGRIPQKKVFWAVRPFSFASNLVQSSFSKLVSGVRGTTHDYLYLVDVSKNNRELLNENEKLRAELGALTELKLENERLRKLLEFKKDTKMRLLAARVIGHDLLPEHNTLTINRGTKHGIKRNMAAITAGGVVGYVIRPQYLTAQVLLLTDRYASIDAIVQRTRSRGLVEGLTREYCQLNYIKSSSVELGDLIVTSGLQDVFPKGFPIATVGKIEKSLFDVSPKIQLKPVINPLHLEELFIILNTRDQDLTSSNKDQAVLYLKPLSELAFSEGRTHLTVALGIGTFREFLTAEVDSP